MGDSYFVNGRSVIHKGSAAQSKAFPDVCLCPPGPPAGPVPTPLLNTALASDLANGAGSVLTGGQPIATRSSTLSRSTGNEAAQATGGGVATHVVMGPAYPRSFSFNVLAEGQGSFDSWTSSTTTTSTLRIPGPP